METSHDLGALARYHEYTRTRGANRAVVVASRLLLQPVLLTYLTLTRRRPEPFPDGPVLVVANHRSFLDPFLVATLLPWGRPLQFMGKAELFARPRAGWYLSRGGCFPVRRGESDDWAMETGRRVLERGGVLVVFPEGTRLRHGGLGQPRRGAFRLALQTGATVLPVTLTGTARVWRAKWLILPAHCAAVAHEPIKVTPAEPTPEAAAELADRAWQPVLEGWLQAGGSLEPGSRHRPRRSLSERAADALRTEVWPKGWLSSRLAKAKTKLVPVRGRKRS